MCTLPLFSDMSVKPDTLRRLMTQLGCTSCCFIMITSAVPPAMILPSEPASLRSA